MSLSVTVLGCSGTFASAGGACSGYLVRSDATTIWLDCGPGTLGNLQRHVDLAEHRRSCRHATATPTTGSSFPSSATRRSTRSASKDYACSARPRRKHQLDVVCRGWCGADVLHGDDQRRRADDDRRLDAAVLVDRPSRGDPRCANRGRRTHARLHGRHRARVVAVFARPRGHRIRPGAVRGHAQPGGRRVGATLLGPPGGIDGHLAAACGTCS